MGNSEVSHVGIKLLEPMLGTNPETKSIWLNHIAKSQGQRQMKKEGKTDEEIETDLAGILDDFAHC